MIDIHTFNKSLKASWIKKYLDPTNNGRWKFFFDDNLKMYGGKFIFSCNLHKDDIPLLKIRNPFARDKFFPCERVTSHGLFLYMLRKFLFQM